MESNRNTCCGPPDLDCDREPPSPVLALWPRLSPRLRDALYGALHRHGIVSTRKAIAAIRGVDDDVRAFLSRLDEVAPGAETVPPSQDSAPRTAPSPEGPSPFLCSSCVDAAARSFLVGGAEDSNPPVVDAKDFFVRLVRVSTGEFMRWWRKAGLTDDVVSAHLLRMTSVHVGAGDELTHQMQGDLEAVAAVLEGGFILVD